MRLFLLKLRHEVSFSESITVEGQHFNTGQESRNRDEGTIWKSHHANLRREFQMRPGAKPWTGKRPRPQLRGIPGGLKCPSKRTLDLLDTAYGGYLAHKASAGEPVEAKPGWFVEFGQSGDRKLFGPHLPLVSTKNKVYHYGLDAVMSAQQLSACHGYPLRMNADDVEEAHLNMMLGNGVFLPHLVICVLAAFLEDSAPWHAPEVQAALAARSSPSRACPPTPLSSAAKTATKVKKQRVRFNI